MSSNAISAQGTVFAVSPAGSPPVWANIPEIKSLGGPDGSAALIDVTDLNSTAKEFILGLKDEGAFSLGIFYIPSNAVHQQLRTAFSNRTTMQFRITFSDSGTTVWEFSGLVTSFKGDAAVDTPINATVGIKISGSIYETT